MLQIKDCELKKNYMRTFRNKTDLLQLLLWCHSIAQAVSQGWTFALIGLAPAAVVEPRKKKNKLQNDSPVLIKHTDLSHYDVAVEHAQ